MRTMSVFVVEFQSVRQFGKKVAQWNIHIEMFDITEDSWYHSPLQTRRNKDV